MKRCTSCKNEVSNDVGAITINCPLCKAHLVRCAQCRKTAVNYKCECGFEGP